MLVVGTALLLALMVGVNAFLLGNLRDATLRTAERDLLRHSLTLSEQADRAFKALDLVLFSIEEYLDRVVPEGELADAPAVHGRDMHEFLKDKLIGLPQVDGISIIGAQGKLLNFSRAVAVPDISVSDRDYFRALSHDDSPLTYISAPVENRGSGTWSLYMARRVNNAAGAFKGLVIGSMSLQHFEDFYRASSAGDGSAISLIRNDGMLLARYPRTEQIGTLIKHSAPFVSDRASIARFVSSIDNKARLTSSHFLANYPLIVLASQTEESIFASWWRIVEVSAMMQAATAMGLIGMAVLLARWLIQRDALARAANEQAESERARALAETELLRERERAADAASRAKSSFLAVMSHEIRTPMNAVLGLAATLLSSDLKPEDHEAVRAIHDAGDNLLEILNDILDYSKLEAGELTLENIAFAPGTITEAPLAILGARALAKNIALHSEIAPDLPAGVIGDAGRLRQVLLNIISNAVKFTEKGCVTAAVRCLAREGDRAMLEWEVRDTGIGIAPEKVGLLFRDYVQADSSINRRFGGSGLGLAICKRIIEQMHGKITVTSELGKGTTVRFSVELEITEAPAQTDTLGHDEEDALRRASLRLGRPLRILVVDDNATNRLVASRMLRALDAQVDVAADGAEAVTAAARFAYDLILMDMRMPEMDGMEATRVIRARQGPSATAPIIALTANAFAEDVQACLSAGMADFVAKPVRKKTLLAAMVRQLEGAGAPSSQATEVDLAAPDAPLVDQDAYRALESEIGPEAMQEAVAEFMGEAQSRLEALVGLSDCRNRVALRREAHSLKGMAGQFGFVRLSRAAAELEAAHDTLTPEAAVVRVGRLQDIFVQSRGAKPGDIAQAA
jgi:signal transduction histidine kinase/CheY-like chemotaxis protein/HPt (histidine-containing phosphotransfer) domain-containing protein